MMNEPVILGHITKIVARMLSDKGQKIPQLNPDSELLSGAVGIDSLDLAMLVRELEEIVGFDPFQEGFIEFRTVGELAKLYVR